MAAEQARLESEARIRDFADTAADWFWEMGTDLRFSYLSESYAARTGLRAEDVLGKTRREIFAQRVKDSPKLDVLLRETDEHKTVPRSRVRDRAPGWLDLCVSDQR